MAGFDSLGKTLRVRAAQVGRNSLATQRKATTVLATELIRGTPVDKGVARSNWQVSAGASSAVPRAAFAPGRRLGLAENANAAAAIAEAVSVINSAPPGSDLYVSNPIPYIGKLDDGSSNQSKHFVRRALAVARFTVRRRKIFEDEG